MGRRRGSHLPSCSGRCSAKVVSCCIGGCASSGCCLDSSGVMGNNLASILFTFATLTPGSPVRSNYCSCRAFRFLVMAVPFAIRTSY